MGLPRTLNPIKDDFGGGGQTSERRSLQVHCEAAAGDIRGVGENFEGRKTEPLLAYIDTLEVYEAAPKPLEAPGRRKLERGGPEGSVGQ